MQKLYYQFPGPWFGDCMPFGHGDKFYLYHQRDTRKPGPFGEPFGWDLATTSDFVHYEDKGVAIPRGTDEEQDQFIFAGSVFEAEGQYHIFYTGYNRDYPALGKPSQVLMHAYSDDLVTWHKTQDALTFTPQEGYDPDDWRDPWVIRDEENDQYLLILGARLQGPKTRQTGRTVKFTSKDLKNWKFEGDFWAPDLYTMHEMPDLFKIGDWWYHIVTEYSDRSKMVYRMSKSLEGPWIAPKDDAFDGRSYYAGRTFELNGQRILFGWVATKDQDDDDNNFIWAGTFMAHEVYQREDGTLGVRIPETVWNAFDKEEKTEDYEGFLKEGDFFKRNEDLLRDVIRERNYEISEQEIKELNEMSVLIYRGMLAIMRSDRDKPTVDEAVDKTVKYLAKTLDAYHLG